MSEIGVFISKFENLNSFSANLEFQNRRKIEARILEHGTSYLLFFLQQRKADFFATQAKLKIRLYLIKNKPCR